MDTFIENHPEYKMVDDTCLPVVFLKISEQSAADLTSLVDYLNAAEAGQVAESGEEDSSS